MKNEGDNNAYEAFGVGLSWNFSFRERTFEQIQLLFSNFTKERYILGSK